MERKLRQFDIHSMIVKTVSAYSLNVCRGLGNAFVRKMCITHIMMNVGIVFTVLLLHDISTT